METEAAMETVQEGFTPLYIAAQEGHAAATKQLIEARCNVDLQDEHGCTPLFITAEKGDAAVTELLIAARCNVDLQDKDGCTPLHDAAENGHFRHIDGRPGDNLPIPLLVTKHMVSGGNRVSCSKDECLVILIV